MAQKKKPKEKSKINWIKENRKVITTLAIFIFGFISGGLSFTVVGEQEFQTSIVGMKIGASTKTQSAFTFDYIDIEEDTSGTMDYSTWHPEKDFSNYPQHKMEKYQWDIDPDSSVHGVPNVQINIPSEYYPTNSMGTIIDDFEVTDKTITFIDPNGIEWENVFYQTYIGTQFTITVHGSSDIVPWDNWAGEAFIGQESIAETPATYKCNENDNTQQSLVGAGADFRVVLRNQIKEFKVGESTHSDPYSQSTNAFVFAKISSVTTNIELTSGWAYEGAFTGDLVFTQLTMYPTCKSALLRESQLSDVDVDEIEFEDTLYDAIYLGFDYDVKLGANWNTQGLIEDWALYREEDNGMDIQAWQILVNVYFSIFTVYSNPPNLADHEQYSNLVNPFERPDVIDNKFNFLEWLTDAWQTPWGKGLIIAGMVIIAIGVGYVFFQFVLPLILKRRATKKALGM